MLLLLFQFSHSSSGVQGGGAGACCKLNLQSAGELCTSRECIHWGLTPALRASIMQARMPLSLRHSWDEMHKIDHARSHVKRNSPRRSASVFSQTYNEDVWIPTVQRAMHTHTPNCTHVGLPGQVCWLRSARGRLSAPHHPQSVNHQGGWIFHEIDFTLSYI